MPLKLCHFGLVEYENKMRRPFATARKSVARSLNYIAFVSAVHQETVLTGVGEATPRGAYLTRDPAEEVWPFFKQVADRIAGHSLSNDSPQAAIRSIRTLMEDLTRIGRAQTNDQFGPKPFRGSLTGIETALLDLAARHFGMTLGAFLGGCRQDITVSAITTPAATDFASYQERLKKYGALYPGWRVKGDHRKDVNLDYLRQLSLLNRTHYDGRRFIWMDLNEALSPEAARNFIEQIQTDRARGDIVGKVILEQPVKAAETSALADLQALADQTALPHDTAETCLRVMADESLISMEDWDALTAAGGVGAVNIKIAKAGGLLASLELAEAVNRFDPEIEVYLGGMLATSDLSARAILAVARGLKRLDYVTSGPRANSRMSNTPLKFAAKTNTILPEEPRSGLGADPDLDKLADCTTRYLTTGDLPRGQDALFNSYLKKARAAQAQKANDALIDPPYFEHDPQPLPLLGSAVQRATHPPGGAFYADAAPLPRLPGLSVLLDATALAVEGQASERFADLPVRGQSEGFTAPTKSARPDWQSSPVQALLSNPQATPPTRMKMAQAMIPTEGDFYLCISFTVGDTTPIHVMGQGRDRGVRLTANMSWKNNSAGQRAAPGALVLYVNGAQDGIGPEGQPAAGQFDPNLPVVVELIGRAGTRRTELRVNGLIVDRFTRPASLRSGGTYLFAPSGASRCGRVALHAAAVAAPLPDTQQQRSLYNWAHDRAGLRLPVPAPPAFSMPPIDAPVALAMEAETGLPLLQRDADIPLPPASMVKILTAALVMREIEKDPTSPRLEDRATIEDSDLWPGTSARFQSGDIVTVNDLLHGMALASGNDGGRALARIYGQHMLARDGQKEPGVRKAHLRFVTELNALSGQIGLSPHAYFTSFIGGALTRLTARDIAVMARYAFTHYPTLVPIFGAAKHVPNIIGSNARHHVIPHTCPLQSLPDGPLAAKTGTMRAAGACLMTWWAKPQGEPGHIAIVTLGSKINPSRFGDHFRLYSYLCKNKPWER